MPNSRYKFRAFGHENKKMIEVGTIELFIDGTLDLNEEFSTNFQGKELWTLMQSTGLVDSEGRECFEGDILQNSQKGLWIIEWGEMEDDGLPNGVGFRFPWNFPDIQLYKVIGNIHEHPSLLKDKMGGV